MSVCGERGNGLDLYFFSVGFGILSDSHRHHANSVLINHCGCTGNEKGCLNAQH